MVLRVADALIRSPDLWALLRMVLALPALLMIAAGAVLALHRVLPSNTTEARLIRWGLILSALAALCGVLAYIAK
jgi:hypothetical protein